MSDDSLDLRPVTPDAADDAVRAIYDDTRHHLRLPWVGALFQGYAMYPDYLELAWNAVRDSLETPPFAAAATAIGALADDSAARLYIPSYDERDIAAMNLDILAIKDTVDAFRVGNPKLLLVATALRRAYAEGPVGGATGAGADLPNSAPESVEEARVAGTVIETIDPGAAPERVAHVFDDIEATLDLPLVNTDYRALALWPDYLELAWRDIKGPIETPEYVEAKRRLSTLAGEGINRFAAPVAATREAARGAGVPEDQLDNLGAILDLFADLLPGLILNIAMFYRAIA
jgi:hypothetical protein